MLEITLVLIGLFAGFIIANIVLALRSATGVLRIDHSNPEKDLYRLDIEDLDKLDKKTYFKLKIDHNANLSQYLSQK